MHTPSDRILLLQKRIAEILDEAPALGEILRGTVGQRTVRCGKETCHCRDGEGHGPVRYLSVSLGAGQTKQMTLTPETYEIAQRYVHNYTRLKEILEEVSTINREILHEEQRSDRRHGRDGGEP